ncbi:MAG TPA: Ig-like domain-containing protein, partial [Verrucomicrobiae bacterium]
PAGDTHAIQVTATNADNSIARVDFYENGVWFATATNSPYITTWTNVYAGTFLLTARAYDGAGGNASATNQVTSRENLSQPAYDGRQITYVFYGQRNVDYIVYTSTNLVDWINLPGVYSITNGGSKISISNLTDPQRYYRMVED